MSNRSATGKTARTHNCSRQLSSSLDRLVVRNSFLFAFLCASAHNPARPTKSELESRGILRPEQNAKRVTTWAQIKSLLSQFLVRRPKREDLVMRNIIRDIPRLYRLPLEEVLQREGRRVPCFVGQAIRMIEERGLREEGIYRIAGLTTEIQSLIGNLEENPLAEIPPTTGIHAVSGALKRFLRDLPVPLLPFDLYDDFLDANDPDSGIDPAARDARLMALMGQVPLSHRDLIMALIAHLNKVAALSAVNKMSTANVAVIFGPCFMRSREPKASSLLFDAPGQVRVVAWLLANEKPLQTAYPVPDLEELLQVTHPAPAAAATATPVPGAAASAAPAAAPAPVATAAEAQPRHSVVPKARVVPPPPPPRQEASAGSGSGSAPAAKAQSAGPMAFPAPPAGRPAHPAGTAASASPPASAASTAAATAAPAAPPRNAASPSPRAGPQPPSRKQPAQSPSPAHAGATPASAAPSTAAASSSSAAPRAPARNKHKEPIAKAVAKHDFQGNPANTPTELSFRKGDRIDVYRRDASGWWIGALEGTAVMGWFPDSFVAECPADAPQ
ncbi:putative Rho GTPase-activating protein 15 [Paratrimastix pyriformis]|uniref:Rho GTPase-activating protein 15 n=1 Tax=Paratrimastix pyriformis TaxID=342808 RepID=A0ABQ8UTR5_9EUKA|nr:putative Rho GTPase-activating protein 15 [Paratrimastix pyriformis]